MIHIDMETFSSVDLKSAGMHRYMESPDFEILLMSYAEDDHPAICIDLTESPSERRQALALLRSFEGCLKVAHNAPFEMNAISKQGITVCVRDWRCSAVLAAYLSLPRSLGELSDVMKLAPDKAKDKRGKQLIQMFCKPRKPTKNDPRTRYTRETHPVEWAQFMEYCRMDVEAEREVWNRLQPVRMPDFEWDRWFFDQEVNQRGMLVDMPFVEAAIEVDREYRGRLMEEARELTGLMNPNSGKQLLAWLKEEMPEDEVESLKKTEVKRLLGAADDATVERVLRIRQELAKTSVKKYAALRKGVCRDSRLRGSLLFYGASRTHRWSGKMFQPHNLPQNHMDDLEGAREVVRTGDLDLVDFLYGSVSNVLSELIRTAIVAPRGKKFIIADFSAIEARMLAWLAGEEWVLEVFRGHGKIYEATAAQMFNVPIESVTKGSEMRRNGKISQLAFGYGGGAGAIAAMDTKKEIPEDMYEPLKKMWRAANPNIVKWWWQVDEAATEAVKNPGLRYKAGKVSFIREKGFLFCDMPDGNRLCYPRPRIKWDEKFEKDSIVYEGVDQNHPKWGEIRTYGPKLVENCLSGDSLVFTDRGLVRLDCITLEDLIWDGVAFVKHMGLTYLRLAHTISVDGVQMTPEHRVLTEDGWRDASSCQGYHRAETRIPDYRGLPRIGREEVTLGCTLLGLRTDQANEGESFPRQHILWMPEERPDRREKPDTRDGESSGVLGMEVHGGQVPASHTSGVEELRGERDHGLGRLAGVPKVLGGYGPDIQEGLDAGSGGQRKGLLQGELPLGDEQDSGAESEEHGGSGRETSEPVEPGDRYRAVHPVLQVLEGPEGERPVYDIKDCGPRNRFVVLGQTGPLVVHNCTQSLSRSALVEGMLAVDRAGFPIVLHIHDEAVVEADPDVEVEVIEKLLAYQPAWAPDLPLRADGFESLIYRKDG